MGLGEIESLCSAAVSEADRGIDPGGLLVGSRIGRSGRAEVWVVPVSARADGAGACVRLLMD